MWAGAVDAAVLSRLLKELGAGVGSGNLLDLLACVAFKGREAMTWNGTNGVRTGASPLEAQFAVHHQKVQAIAQSYEKCRLTLTADRGRLTIQPEGRTARASLATFPIEDYPFSSMEGVDFKPLTDPALPRAIQAALCTCEREDVHSPYVGIHLSHEGGTSFVVSSDRVRATYVEVRHPLEGVVLPVPLAQAVAKRGMPMAVGQDGRFIYFKYGEIVLFGLPLASSFPAVHRVVSGAFVPLPHPASLAGAISRAMALGVTAVRYTAEDHRFEALGSAGDELEELMDLGKENFHLNLEQFRQAVAQSEGMVTQTQGRDLITIFKPKGLAGGIYVSHLRD